MYITLLVLMCRGTTVTTLLNQPPKESRFEQAIALGSHREAILFEGAVMPMINMRNNQFKIDYVFNLDRAIFDSDYNKRYVGTYDYGTNTLSMSEYRSYGDRHTVTLATSARCEEQKR